MSYKLAFIGAVSIASIAVTVVSMTHRAIVTGASPALASIPPQVSDDARIMSLIRELRSNDESTRTAAKTALIQLSMKSTPNREAVTGELLRIIRTSNPTADIIKHPEHYLEWAESTEILGSIKATEAINDLIQCLDCNNGLFGLSVERFPAAAALVKMGDQAVPKLSEAIEDRRPMTRYVCSLALAQIGGDSARHVLQVALRKEHDKQVAATIRNLLQRWDNSTLAH